MRTMIMWLDNSELLAILLISMLSPDKFLHIFLAE